MNGTLDDVLTVARRNIGFVEGPNNSNPYAKSVGHANHQPWCASFVAAVFKAAGVGLPSTSAYTPTMANGFKAAKAWGTKPRVGAVVFFQWPGMGRIAHVGIVETIRPDGTIICIEGNTDVKGGRTGGRVMRQARRANIAGYGYPVYKATPAPVRPAAPAKKATPAPATPVTEKPVEGDMAHLFLAPNGTTVWAVTGAGMHHVPNQDALARGRRLGYYPKTAPTKITAADLTALRKQFGV